MNTTNMRKHALGKWWLDKAPQLKQPLWTLLGSLVVLLSASCSLQATPGADGQGGTGGVGGAGVVANCASKDCDSSYNKLTDNSADRAGESSNEASAQGEPQQATACTKDADCASGFCTDGFCCNLRCDDVCMACSAAIKGGGADGVCGPIKYDTDPQNECPSGSCDGAYACKKHNGNACSVWTDCLSHYCVDGFCCNNLCNTECVACSNAKKGNGANGVCGPIGTRLDPDNECNPGECNGSGSCTLPQTTKLPNGAPCVSYNQCSSGYCADGVCCDTPCRNPNLPGQTTNWCQACTAAKKGGGVDGVCGPIKYDSDPDNECWGGACDGNKQCALYVGHACDKTSQCLSTYCIDGFCCNNFCGSGCAACSAAKKGDGTQDGLCGWIAAGTDPDNECNPGECTAANTCSEPQTPQALGTPCTGALQCASGFCADGVCCDDFCVGTCRACSAAKKGDGTADGTCGFITAGSDPELECPGGGCAGTAPACRYYNGVPCNSASDCISNYCVDGVCCGNVCNLPCMACTASKKGYGTDGGCGMISAGSDPDNECTDPSQCNGAGACQ